MKKIAISIVLLIALLGTSIAYAMETKTYYFTASSQDTIIPIITYRAGDITASAVFIPNNHGLYGLWVFDEFGNQLCIDTRDFRWGRTSVLPMVCHVSNAFVGRYSVVFRAAMGGKVSVTMNIVAETNP